MVAFFSSSQAVSLLGWLTVLSLITFLLSIILIPIVVNMLSSDCFRKLTLKPADRPVRSQAMKVFFLIIRNTLGVLLFLAGLLMLFLPGQGLLTLLLSFMLLSIPGKQRLIVYLVKQKNIQKSLDWLRRKGGRPPFVWPQP